MQFPLPPHGEATTILEERLVGSLNNMVGQVGGVGFFVILHFPMSGGRVNLYRMETNLQSGQPVPGDWPMEGAHLSLMH